MVATTLRGRARAAAVGPGTSFWIYKQLTSSGITTSAADLTGVSSGGKLYIKQIILKTDGTGLAAGTNFVLSSNNANGLANILSTAVSGLGANKTVTLLDASVTKVPTILESGKKIQHSCTGSACTGSGKIDVYIECVRLDEDATIAAA